VLLHWLTANGATYCPLCPLFICQTCPTKCDLKIATMTRKKKWLWIFALIKCLRRETLRHPLSSTLSVDCVQLAHFAHFVFKLHHCTCDVLWFCTTASLGMFSPSQCHTWSNQNASILTANMKKKSKVRTRARKKIQRLQSFGPLKTPNLLLQIEN